MSKQAASDSPIHTSRRYFRRFTLRTLLLLVALIGVGCAIVTWLLREPIYPIVLVSSPVVSPSGEKVAFVLTRGDERSFNRQKTGDVDAFERFSETIDVRLWIISVNDGQSTDTRAEISGGSTPLTWGRDESHIVFVSGRIDPIATTSHMALESIDLKTRGLASVAPGEIWMPQYSPNGANLGYVRGSDLIVENLQTGKRTLVSSGVSHHYWCWGVNNSLVFYIRAGLLVCEYDIRSGSERILFSAPVAEEKYPSHVICSPDGSLLGYHIDDWFHTIDLKSGKIEKHFKCDHYFIDFDWNVSGICYVDAVNGERKSKAALMVYDPIARKSSIVATGPFAYPRWVGTSRVLVRKGNTEIWTYGVPDGKGAKLFARTDEDE